LPILRLLHAKVLDATILQKISQQRQSNFYDHSSVPGAPSREKMLEDEKALVRQYGKETAEKMRRNGFSGLSIEERARQVGLSTEYNIVYRNFSRNIHNTDYMEHLADRGVIDRQRWQLYQYVRDHTALSTAVACTWRTALVRRLDARAHVFRSLGAVLAAVPFLQALGPGGG
jgi:hypothetical protein